jgi:hypothetical protein
MKRTYSATGTQERSGRALLPECVLHFLGDRWPRKDTWQAVVGKKHAGKCPSVGPVAVHKPQGGLVGYAALLLERVFGPLHGQLEELEEREFSSRLAHPISPQGRLDWPEVDEEIRELRRRFESATTQQDHRAVGMAC